MQVKSRKALQPLAMIPAILKQPMSHIGSCLHVANTIDQPGLKNMKRRIVAKMANAVNLAMMVKIVAKNRNNHR